MVNLKEKQKKEAISNLKTLVKTFDLDPQILKNFEQGKVCYGEDIKRGEISKLNILEENRQYLSLVEKFEKETNALVYYCILTPAEFIFSQLTGYCFSLLYVSEYTEDWSVGRLCNVVDNGNGFRYGDLYSYTYNLYKDGDVIVFDEGECEYGGIVVHDINGVLGRMS